MVYAVHCAVSSMIVHYWGAQKTVKFSCRRCWKNRDTVVLLHRSPKAGIFSATKHVHLGSMDTQQVGAPDTFGTLREFIGITLLLTYKIIAYQVLQEVQSPLRYLQEPLAPWQRWEHIFSS